MNTGYSAKDFVSVKYGSYGSQLMLVLGEKRNGDIAGYKFSRNSRTFTKNTCNVPRALCLGVPEDNKLLRDACEAAEKRFPRLTPKAGVQL